MTTAPYEEQFSRLGRWMRRGLRPLQWGVKRAVGIPRSILVELNWRLGDEIMALPVFESIRGQYPADHIAVLTHYPELFENHPFVDAVNVVPRQVDRYILLRGAPRTQYRLAHYAEKAGVPLPTLRPYLYYQDWDVPQLAALPGGDGPLVAVAPGASWASKRWPKDRWAALCRVLMDRGCRVVELGENDEAIGVGTSFVGQTTVREAACILKAADVLVCCDSGLMHLGLAVTTPVVALFGITDPEVLVRGENQFAVLRSDQPCRGYWNRPGVDPAPGMCPHGHACCLDTISVEQVLEKVGDWVVFPKRGL